MSSRGSSREFRCRQSHNPNIGTANGHTKATRKNSPEHQCSKALLHFESSSPTPKPALGDFDLELELKFEEQRMVSTWPSIRNRGEAARQEVALDKTQQRTGPCWRVYGLFTALQQMDVLASVKEESF
ncbi:uncharacterized protein Z519_02497 [Cladophialophora bantiana CBS 173.52]|uniref:Uncharacterized protein n=1 Tax=Cladophialophora bantiana (strain ATCC 10958 / CBS 173.52 / CDC B-1940 / NIH 8579) TaxID=1442370 RepID=A0A0D2I1R5_CLAB1|nr:uncharacterized protein Z519_02497 [Cladophialophora bantiana CBS 173.52]KIW97105.1 hypothetical protein Z519_02497 [Cladophialophora bantiana CBS 173.52]